MKASPRHNVVSRVILGLAFGLLGVALDVAAYAALSLDSVVGMRDAFSVSAAFFFGPLAGIVAGAVCSLGRLAMPLWGIRVMSPLQGPIASLAAALFAVAIHRWLFGRSRPAALPAALFAAFAGVVHITVVFVFGLGDPIETLGNIADTYLGIIGSDAALAFALSLALRARQTLRQNAVALAAAAAFAALLVAIHAAVGRIATDVTEKQLERALDGYARLVEDLGTVDQLSRFGSRHTIAQSIGIYGECLVAERTTGRILLSGRHVGQTLADGAIERIDFAGASSMVEGDFFGEASYVRRRQLEATPVDIYVAMPVDEAMFARSLSILFALIIVSLLGSLATMTLATIRRQARALDELLTREAEHRRRDLELARNIQLSVLPTVFRPIPDSGEVDIYAEMRTALEVGGDFYDFFPLGSRRLALVIADVSDKGVPAAMFMMKAKAVLRSRILGGESLQDAIGEVNEALCQNNSGGMFVTAWAGVFDLDRGLLEYVNAGHNPPILKRSPGGEIETLGGNRNLVLACLAGRRYEISTATLKPGDRLFLYTDGVTEAKSADGELFGERRLVAELAASGLTSRDDCRRVIAALDRFAANAPQADDITVFELLWHGRDRVQTRAFPATLEGLADAAAFLRRTLDETDCVKKAKSALMVAMDEIASNIVRYSGAPDFTVRIELAANPPVVRVVFSDCGKPYNPLEREDPDVSLSVDEREVGGLGLFMVRKLMDEVEYAHVNGRNVLTIGKRGC